MGEVSVFTSIRDSLDAGNGMRDTKNRKTGAIDFIPTCKG